MNVLALSPRRRGTDLLLAHCGVYRRAPAADRLGAELGSDFSRRLVKALAPDQRGGAGLRGSSSP
jgi:hypothetical protein